MALLCRAMSALPSRALSAARLPRSHLRVLLAAVVLVLLAHGGLLFGLPPGFGPQPAAGGVVALQVRQILVPRAVPAVTAANPAPRRPSAAPAAARRPAPAGRAVDTAVDPGAPARPQEEAGAPEAETPGRGEAASEEVLMRTDEAGRPLDPALPLPEPLPQAAPDAPAASPAGELRVPRQGGGDTPVYPTRMPAAATLHYDLLRGVLAGQARLDWQPAAQGYEARVEGLLFGMPVVAWHSQGGFDSNGIAPERFTDRRRSRDLRAANFLREAGRITFSGPPVEFPCWPGRRTGCRGWCSWRPSSRPTRPCARPARGSRCSSPAHGGTPTCGPSRCAPSSPWTWWGPRCRPPWRWSASRASPTTRRSMCGWIRRDSTCPRGCG